MRTIDSEMLKGFRDFVMRGNVIDLAIAVIIGAAFGAVVTAFSTDFVGGLLGALGGTPDFGDAGVTVNGSKIVYGSTLTALIQFLIVAAVIYFVIVVPVTRLAERRGAAESESPAPSDETKLLTEIRDLLADAAALARARLALGQQAVAPDIAAGAPDADVDGVGVGRLVAQRADRRGVDAHEVAGPERELVVAQRERDPARVDEVELLLALVEVAPAAVAGRHHDRVHAEGRHAELLAHLAEAPALAHRVDPARGPAVARRDLRHARDTTSPMAADATLEEFLEPVRRDPSRSAILLDVDGVLAPIVPQPDDAHMPETTRRPLIEVARRYGTVACVSGRRASDARRIVALGSIAYLGNHGSEVLRPGATGPELDRELQAWTRRIQGFMADAFGEELKRLRVRLEDKEAIAALHWRGVPDEEGAEDAVRAVAERAEASGYKTHWGRKVLEIRPPVRIDKGAGIVALLRDRDLAAALYVGDDLTDVDAFKGLAELVDRGTLGQALKVGVRSDEGPPELEQEADVMVDGTDGVRELLRTLLV